MAVHEIISYVEHSDSLRKKSQVVKDFNQNTTALIKDLKDTLNAHPDGIGLAPPQINVHQRVVVLRVGGGGTENSLPGHPIALINPKIIAAADERKDFDGCLSFPGLFGETVRPHYLRVTGLDETGKDFDIEYEGFESVIVHHEIDHLDGILFIDRIARIEDLYRIRETENGELAKVPLEGVASKLHQDGFGVTVEVCEGPVVDAILGTAARYEVDLLAMSTQGKGEGNPWMMGSVVDRVLRESPVQVFLFRPERGEINPSSSNNPETWLERRSNEIRLWSGSFS
jgi:peptide deformylase